MTIMCLSNVFISDYLLLLLKKFSLKGEKQ